MFDDTKQRDRKLPDLCCAWEEFGDCNWLAWWLHGSWNGYVGVTLRPILCDDLHKPGWGWTEIRALTLRED